jgi:hypothetical protein
MGVCLHIVSAILTIPPGRQFGTVQPFLQRREEPSRAIVQSCRIAPNHALLVIPSGLVSQDVAHFFESVLRHITENPFSFRQIPTTLCALPCHRHNFERDLLCVQSKRVSADEVWECDPRGRIGVLFVSGSLISIGLGMRKQTTESPYA